MDIKGYLKHKDTEAFKAWTNGKIIEVETIVTKNLTGEGKLKINFPDKDFKEWVRIEEGETPSWSPELRYRPRYEFKPGDFIVRESLVSHSGYPNPPVICIFQSYTEIPPKVEVLNKFTSYPFGYNCEEMAVMRLFSLNNELNEKDTNIYATVAGGWVLATDSQIGAAFRGFYKK